MASSLLSVIFVEGQYAHQPKDLKDLTILQTDMLRYICLTTNIYSGLALKAVSQKNIIKKY